MNIEKHYKKKFERKNENSLEFYVPKIMFCCVLISIYLLVVCSNSAPNPEFLTAPEYEVIKAYIGDTEEKANMFASILDSRTMSETEATAFEDVIEDLNEALKSMETLMAIGSEN